MTSNGVLSLDCETTISNNGHPYDRTNSLVCYSYATDQGSDAEKIGNTKPLLDNLSKAKVVVGFNFKFDLHWFEKEGISFNNVEIWDVQIAEFILSCQTNRLPSLNETCEKYGLPLKKDVVKTEYWDKGIDTDQIPWEILQEYAAYDAYLTLMCYYKQLPLMTPAQIKLCKLQCQDLKILREMEANGVPFDEELCQKKSLELDDKISEINRELSQIYPNVPINFNSNDQLSAFLYGGTIKEDGKEHVGFYKTGEKAGQPKYKNIIIEHNLPRLYKPLPNTEMAKEGIYSTNEGVLKKLKGKKGIIDKILELSKLEKMNGTYYKGLVKLRQEMNWEPNILHGNFNQTIAATGRLSSNKPNLQNFASELQDIFVSKYND